MIIKVEKLIQLNQILQEIKANKISFHLLAVLKFLLSIINLKSHKLTLQFFSTLNLQSLQLQFHLQTPLLRFHLQTPLQSHSLQLQFHLLALQFLLSNLKPLQINNVLQPIFQIILLSHKAHHPILPMNIVHIFLIHQLLFAILLIANVNQSQLLMPYNL